MLLRVITTALCSDLLLFKNTYFEQKHTAGILQIADSFWPGQAMLSLGFLQSFEWLFFFFCHITLHYTVRLIALFLAHVPQPLSLELVERRRVEHIREEF